MFGLVVRRTYFVSALGVNVVGNAFITLSTKLDSRGAIDEVEAALNGDARINGVKIVNYRLIKTRIKRNPVISGLATTISYTEPS